MFLNHTQPHTMSKQLGCDYKSHGKKTYSGPSAGEQIYKLHQLNRIAVELVWGKSGHLV